MTVVDEMPKQDVEKSWREQASLLRVMAHPVRLAILEALCRRPHCVKHINSLLPVSQPQLSQHMAALRKENLVACHACGPVRCYYVLRPTLVKEMMRLLGQEHPVARQDCESVVEKAREGWEQDMETTCERGTSSEAGVPAMNNQN